MIVQQYRKIIANYAEKYSDLDVLLATSAFQLGTAKTAMPLVLWGDTTFAGVLNKYDRYVNLSRRTVAQCHAAEQCALTSCDIAIFSSQWAADVAQASYEIDRRKIRVITYGANLLTYPSEAEVREFISSRSREALSLVIVGAQWERKGVDKAVATVGKLRQRGLDAKLKVVGCYPPSGRAMPEYVSVVGGVSKSSPEGRRHFEMLMGTSHLLILPTVAECAAVVLAEAGAFGLPALATDVGGNASLIRPGTNGYLLPENATAERWADVAERILCGGRRPYEDAAWRAFRFFHQELSWERSVAKFEIEMQSFLSARMRHEISA